LANSNSTPLTVGQLAEQLGGSLVGHSSLQIKRVAPLETADAASISFLADARYVARLQASAAGCVILPLALHEAAAKRTAQEPARAVILCADPYLAFARLTQIWAAQQARPWQSGVHATAVVEPGATVHPSAHIAALAYVAAGAVIGPGVRIGVQAHVAAHAAVGEGTWLKPRVVLGERCRIGARGLVHSGAVIGADGFGFAPLGGELGWEKIEQLGAVQIGDDVEIGANSCIDRGALDDTVVEDGVKIDNLVQLGHNVHVGAHTAIAGCVGVAGSARIGRHCRIGGAAMIIGHLEIADHVVVTAGTLISRSIHKAGTYSGAFPFDDNASWEKNAATLRQLYSLRERVRALEKKA
jgi:UDP-3-O-[3-hydroxymyristoyl] glucosamine N-acyltransferase